MTEQEGVPLSEFFPFGILITNRKTTTVYQRFFQELRSAGKWSWKPNLWMGIIDMEVGISNTVKNVFPNSTWHYCWFHVSQNVVSKLDELKFPLPKLKHLIFNEIKKIHQSTTVANAKKKISKFTKLLSTI